jgi:hypothetical protein
MIIACLCEFFGYELSAEQIVGVGIGIYVVAAALTGYFARKNIKEGVNDPRNYRRHGA